MESVARRPQGFANPGLKKLFVVWFVLVAVSVVGRLWQPAWNVTPLAGAAIAAGAAFPNPLVAASVPLAAFAVSNLVLPGYDLHDWKGFAMVAVIAVALAWPVVLGSRVRTGRLTAIIGSALTSSLVFYLSTNFAHWLLTDDYPHTAGGLLACYVAALPFFRWMPLGDIAWTLALVSGLAASRTAANAPEQIPQQPASAA